MHRLLRWLTSGLAYTVCCCPDGEKWLSVRHNDCKERKLTAMLGRGHLKLEPA